MAEEGTGSRQWGCLDTIVSAKDYILFKEDHPFLVRHASTLGHGTHHLGRELPPHVLVDFVRRRWWPGYVKDVTGRSVQAVATEPYVYSSEDFRAARDAKVARDALERLYTERARFGQLREILGSDVRKLDIHWRGLNPAGINYHAITQFVNRGVPLTHADAKTLLVRMLVDEHIRPYLSDLLEDGCMPDLRSDCVVRYGPELYRVSDLENPEKKSVVRAKLGQRSRARRSEGRAILATQISIGVLDFDSGGFVWHDMPWVNGAVEAGDTGDIATEFLRLVGYPRGVIIEIAINHEADCALSTKSASALRGELLKLAINARNKVKFLC
jgi:hypothetical protein